MLGQQQGENTQHPQRTQQPNRQQPDQHTQQAYHPSQPAGERQMQHSAPLCHPVQRKHQQIEQAGRQQKQQIHPEKQVKHSAKQSCRHNQQTDPGDCQQIDAHGDGTGRHPPQQQPGPKACEGNPLRASPAPPWGTDVQPPSHPQQQQPHRHKRQPITRPQRCSRIDQGDNDHRRQPQLNGRQLTPPKLQQQHQRAHQQCTLNRYLHTGKPGISGRCQQGNRCAQPQLRA